MSIAPLRLGLTATPPPPGEGADRLATLVGPVVFERTVGDLAGRYLAPLERVTWHLALDPDERREHDALWSVYREARRAFEANHLGAPRRGNPERVPPPSRDGLRLAEPGFVHTWEDFLHDAARTDEGRRGLSAWRRARRILAYPRRKREALALLLGHHRAQRTLIFVADNQTAYAVAREHLVMPLTCDIGRTERVAALERFREGTLRALVSAQVLNEGIDVPDAEVGIVVAGRMGEREHVQRVGRLLRPGAGKRALVYELVIEGSSEHWQAERRGERLALRTRSSA
jgi:superfamily II DNA or RNA helicase